MFCQGKLDTLQTEVWIILMFGNYLFIMPDERDIIGYYTAQRRADTSNLFTWKSLLGRVHTNNFTRRAYRSRTVRVGLPVYTLGTLRRVRSVHSDHFRMCSQWTRTVRAGLVLQCECSSGRVRFTSDAPSAHVCRLTYFSTSLISIAANRARINHGTVG